MLPTLAFGFLASLFATQQRSDGQTKDDKIRIRSERKTNEALLDSKFLMGFGKMELG